MKRRWLCAIENQPAVSFDAESQEEAELKMAICGGYAVNEIMGIHYGKEDGYPKYNSVKTQNHFIL